MTTNLPRKVLRMLSADEAMMRYFARREAEFSDRSRIKQVILRRRNQPDLVLQVTDIMDSGHGLVVIVQ
jgi:hypothetical protein